MVDRKLLGMCPIEFVNFRAPRRRECIEVELFVARRGAAVGRVGIFENFLIAADDNDGVTRLGGATEYDFV